MQKTILSLAALASAISFSGCVGSGPNTEAGAVTGGAVGALAGAVIGNNSRGGDAVGGALIGGAAGALAGAAIGNSVDHQEGTIYQPQPQPVAANPDNRAYRVARAYPVQTAVPPPPPTPADAQPPMPAPNAVWAPGYWIYDGRAYTWVGGHWEVPPPGARTYIAAHSENRGGQMVFVPGYWQ